MKICSIGKQCSYFCCQGVLRTGDTTANTSGMVDMVRVLGEPWDHTGFSSCLEMVGRAPMPKGSRLILELNMSDHGPEAPKHRVPT